MVLALVTGLMAWEMTKVKVSYKFGGLLPKTDSAYVNYQVLQSKFSEDGNVMRVGSEGCGLYQLENFREWYRLGVELKDLTGVDSVFSEAHLYDLVRNDSLKRFTLQPLLVREPASQAQVDSLIAQYTHCRSTRGSCTTRHPGPA